MTERTALDVGRALLGRAAMPIDGLLRLGHKGPTGAPTDREFLEVAHADLHKREGKSKAGGAYTIDEHLPHPAASAYNAQPKEQRRTFAARLTGRVADLFGFRRFLQDAPDKSKVPDNAAWCSSNDATTARRWTGSDWSSLACPGDRCQYASPDRDPRSQCKVQSRVTLIAAEPSMPPLRLRLSTKAWASGRNFLGLATLAAAAGETVDMPLTVEVRMDGKGAKKHPTIYFLTRADDAPQKPAPTTPTPDPVQPAAPTTPTLADPERVSAALAEHGWTRENWEAAIGTAPTREAAADLLRRARAGERPTPTNPSEVSDDELPDC